jgi:hypothetical protein
MNLEILSTSNAAPGEEGADIPPNVVASAAAGPATEGAEHTIRLSGNTGASSISRAKDRAEVRSLLMQRGPLLVDAEAQPEQAPQPQPHPQEPPSAAAAAAAAGRHRVQGKKHVMQTGKTFVVRHVP